MAAMSSVDVIYMTALKICGFLDERALGGFLA